MVQDDDHALTVLRYLEANPLRAGMVMDLADYPWSSYPAHGLGRANPLLSGLPSGEGRWATEPQRRRWWRGWVQTPLTEKQLAAVRRSVTSGRPYGEAAWARGVVERLGLRCSERGRPRPQASRAQQQINELTPFSPTNSGMGKHGREDALGSDR